MVNLKGVFLSESPNWRAPQALYGKLDAEFHFDDDPCPYFGAEDAGDGLLRPWGKRVYVNPPYGAGVSRWFEKGLSELRNGTEIVVFLLPARTDTAWFHDYALPNAKEIRFIRGRIHFSEEGPAQFPSILIVMEAP